jgi:uncharacterized protein YjbJ (UPF0337 family)
VAKTHKIYSDRSPAVELSRNDDRQQLLAPQEIGWNQRPAATLSRVRWGFRRRRRDSRTIIMNDRIDNDRVEGSSKNLGGKLKEGLGNLTGDQKTKREGQADQLEGKAQNSWGGMKDSVRDVIDSDDRR